MGENDATLYVEAYFFFENEEKVSVFKKLISRCCVDKRRRINISLESSFFQIAMT